MSRNNIRKPSDIRLIQLNQYIRPKLQENKSKNCQIEYTVNTRIYYMYVKLLCYMPYFNKLFPPKAEVRGSNPLECAILLHVINRLTRTGHLSVPCHL